MAAKLRVVRPRSWLGRAAEAAPLGRRWRHVKLTDATDDELLAELTKRGWLVSARKSGALGRRPHWAREMVIASWRARPIGDALRRARKDGTLPDFARTREAFVDHFASLIGMSPATVDDWLKGERNSE